MNKVKTFYESLWLCGLKKNNCTLFSNWLNQYRVVHWSKWWNVGGVKVALDGGTRPGDTLQIHPHFLSLMADGQVNASRWRDTSPRATLSVVLWITYNFDLIIYNDYYKIP